MQAGETRAATAYFRAALAKTHATATRSTAWESPFKGSATRRPRNICGIASRYDHLKREIVRCGNVPKIEPEVFAQLGEICESLERPDQARVWYQVAIGRDPLDARAQQALTHLDQAAKTDAFNRH